MTPALSINILQSQRRTFRVGILTRFRYKRHANTGGLIVLVRLLFIPYNLNLDFL